MIIVFYFGFLQHFDAVKVCIILLFSVVGILGSYGVAWFGIRINTFANSPHRLRRARGQAAARSTTIPLQAGMSIGMLLICVELLIMLVILLFVPRRLRRAPASSASPSASRSAPRRCASPAASSPRSPTSAPT